MYNVTVIQNFLYPNIRFYSPRHVRASFPKVKPLYTGAWERECRKAIPVPMALHCCLSSRKRNVSGKAFFNRLCPILTFVCRVRTTVQAGNV